MSFYSPINRLAHTLPRPKGTGSEFMTELSKMPGYKSQEAEDRGLQALVNLPKMEREQFIRALKKKPIPPVAIETFGQQAKNNKGLNVTDDETHHEDWTLPGGTNYREILLKHGYPKQDFPGVEAHFGGEPNILASVRAKDRTGPNGEKILHIEELQSDWHQKGREHGYAKELTPEEEKEYRNIEGLPSTEFFQPKTHARYYELLKKREGVPDAPFKKSWHEMALKKMIHHAAANGYDSIAITPGAEQAKRYGLSQAVKHIDATRYSLPSLGPVADVNVAGLNGAPVHAEYGVTEKELEKLLGKELAKKIISQPEESTQRHEGEDLEIGGEGMKGFYDKIVPNFLNQFGKKYGAKVSTVPIESGEEMVPDNAGLGQIRSGKPSIVNLHHFPITPEMRADVTKNGVPLYAKGGEVSRETHDANLAKYLVESQIKHRVYHGTGDTQIRKFKGHRGVAAHFGLDPKIANQFAEERHNDVEDLRRLGDIDPHEEAGAVVYPAYVQVKNIFDVRKPQHRKLIPELRNVDDISFDHLEDAIPEIKKHGFDSYYDFEFGHKTDKNPTGLAVFRPHQIKSAIGNRGTYDPKDPDITKAKGGRIKPIGYTKERVTVSPNLDAMNYELMSVKHYTKKAK